jgi:arylsulfatase A-like enzyme
VGFDFFFGFLPGANNYIRRTGNQGGGVNGRNAAIMRNREVVDEPEYLTDAFGREAAGFVARHARQRFFLYLSFNAPHTPMEATPRDLDRFPRLAGGRRTYAAMVAAMDDAVGRVLAELARNHLREKTLIFFLSDNGGPSGGISTTPNFSSNRPLRGYKATFFEGGIRVPFFVSWPAHVRASQLRHEIVSSLDILPTALAAAGLEAAGSHPPDGMNLLPGLRGDPTAHFDERVLFWRYFGNTAIRVGAWKLLRIEGQPPQLYRVRADGAETRDRAATEGDRVRSLARRTDEWLAGLVAPRWQRRFVEANGRVVLRPLPLAEEHAAEARK